MPLTAEQKRQIISNRGLNPDEYDVLDDTYITKRKPSSVPALTTGTLPTGLATVDPRPARVSGLESFGRGAAEGVAPAGLGLSGAVIGAPLGPVGSIVGAIVGSFLGTEANKELVPEDVKRKLFTRPEDHEQHPVLSYLGGVAPNAVAFNPVKSIRDLPHLFSGAKKLPQTLANTAALTAAEKAALVNAAINAGISGGSQLPGLISGEREFSPGRVLADIASSSLLTRPTAFGRNLGFNAPPEGQVFNPRQGVADIESLASPNVPTQEARQFGIKPGGAVIEPSGRVSKAASYQPFKSAAESGEIIRQSYESIDKNVAEAQKTLEERRQAELEIEKQRTETTKLEAERLRLENEQRKLDLATGLKRGYGEEAPLEERLQTRVEEQRLTQPEARPDTSIGRDLNQAKQAKAQQRELEQPPTYAEQIQEEFDRGIRHAEESKLPAGAAEADIVELPFSNIPIEQLPPNVRSRVRQSVEAEATRRGFRLVRKPTLTNAEGKEIYGRYNRANRTIELNDKIAAGDIPSHETGHGLFDDYLNSSSPKDQRLVLDGLEFADAADGGGNRKFKTVDDYNNLSPEEQLRLEEKFVEQIGVEGFRQRRVDLFGNKRQRFEQWWENVKSHVKTKTGLGDEADVQRHFVTRQRTDAPYGTRGELAPGEIRPTATGAAAEDSQLPAKTDYEQYQDAQANLMRLIKEKKSGSQEFLDAWQVNEDIKNRHGGMPPVKPAADTAREAQESKLPAIKDELEGHYAWMTPEGKFLKVNTFMYHEPTIQNQMGIGIDEAGRQGFVHITGNDSRIEASRYYSTDEEGFKPRELTASQLKKLKDIAIEQKKRLEVNDKVVYDPSERMAEKSELPDDTNKTFETQTEKELSKDAPFGVSPDKEGKLNGNMIAQRLHKYLTPTEQELLGDNFKKFLAYNKHTPSEIQTWLNENGPKVEVHSYGMEGKVSEAKKEYDRMTHEWYDNLSGDKKRQAANFSGNSEALKNYGWTTEEIAQHLKYYDLKRSIRNDGTDKASPRATSHYSSVSALPTNEPMPEWTSSKSSKNVQRVDVVVPLSDVAKGKRWGTPLEQIAAKDEVKWQPDNLHENLPNTLGWAMIQYKTGAKGEKIAVIVEAQSRWGQEQRKYEQIVKENKDSGMKRGIADFEDKSDTAHPLLRDYNRLILKAAIDQARKEGATHIVVSDAETAMMTEGHDLASHQMARGYYETEKEANAGLKDVEKRKDSTYRVEHRPSRLSSKPWVIVQTLLPQEPGMRLNYDTILPKIAEELTGSKGERVSLGEHKNAFKQQKYTDMGGEITETVPRENLIFKNPDGTPKTDVSGTMFPLSQVVKRLQKEPFSISGKRYATKSQLPDSDIKPVESTTVGQKLNNLFSGTIDKIRNKGTPTYKHVATQAEKHANEVSLNLGRYRNTIQQTIVDSSLPSESLERIDTYGRETWTDGKSGITLSPEEQNLYEDIQAFSKKVAEDNKARKIDAKEGYWPAILSQEVAADWSKNPNSPSSTYWKKQWLKHANSRVDSGEVKGITKEEAKTILDDYVTAVASHGDNPTLEFGALRKAEGIGLPTTMQVDNLIERWSRYGQRAARDMASFKYLESDPVMRYALRLKDPKTDKIDRTPPKVGDETMEDVSGDEQVLNLKRWIFNEFPNIRQPKLQALNRLVSSLIMGAPTGVRNVVTAPAVISPLIGGIRNAGAIVEGLTSVGKEWKNSFTYNARQRNLNDLQFGAASHPDKIAQGMNMVADAFRKYSGREGLEQFERAWFFATGKHAAASEFGRAQAGDEQAIKWLKEWGSNVDGGIEQYVDKSMDEISDDVLNTIAAKVSNYAAGTYDQRGLAAGLQEGDLAPFVRLSRWSIERANHIVQRVVKPAVESGNYQPLLTYALGSFLTGAAIKQINELLSGGKKSQEASISEALAADNYAEAARATFSLAQLGSLGGVISDGLKSLADIGTGHKPLRGPLSFPLGSFVTETVGQNIKDLIVAIEAGEPAYDAVMEFSKKMAVESVQTARSMYQMSLGRDNVSRSNKFRDKRIFDELTGKKEPTDVQRSNPFMDLKAKQFKKEDDLGEAAQMLPELIEDATKKGNIEEVMKELSGLKRNSYQTFPDFEKNPIAAAEYLDFLTRTQGAEEAMKRLTDHLQQKTKNKIKSSLVPTL